MSNREIIEWLKKKAETVTMPGARKMYQAAAKALEAQKYMIRRQDVIDELMTWEGHCITDQEEWHLRQVIGSIKSIPVGENMMDLIDRGAAIDALKNDMASLDRIIKGMSANDVRLDAYVSQRNQVNYDICTINSLPPAQPEIIYCKECKYWNSGTCECREHVVNCQDYMVGDMETDAEHFCGYAERREE